MHFTGYTTATSGTNRYLAPELSDPDVSEPKLSLATDVYSFAVTSLEVQYSVSGPRLNGVTLTDSNFRPDPYRERLSAKVF